MLIKKNTLIFHARRREFQYELYIVRTKIKNLN